MRSTLVLAVADPAKWIEVGTTSLAPGAVSKGRATCRRHTNEIRVLIMVRASQQVQSNGEVGGGLEVGGGDDCSTTL
jgi:hypothetical protein